MPQSDPGSHFTAWLEASVIAWRLDASVAAVTHRPELEWEETAGVLTG